MPFFSVIIPLFNKEKHIEKTIRSVLEQGFENFELIIVNDGSTDKSLERANAISDPRIKLYDRRNSGASAARNFGVEKAKSQHIALLDADDIWQSNHLEEHNKSIEKFPDAALYCNAYSLKLTDNFEHKATYVLPKQDEICLVPDYFEASMIHPIAMTNTVVFKKRDFMEIGGFDPKILSGQDLDLWIRFGLQKQIVFNPTVTTCYDKTVENSLSKGNYIKSKYELFHSFRKEEPKNASLKKYLDLNRYSLAIQCKYRNDTGSLKKLKSDISLRSLNAKQTVLLSAPSWMVRNLKQFQLFLIRKGIYLTAFK